MRHSRLPAAVVQGGSALARSPADPQGAPLQRTEQRVLLKASPAEVWAAIGKFSDLGWHPAVAATDAPKGEAVGGLRTLTLGGPGGPTLVEALTAYDAAGLSYSYSIPEPRVAILPVTDYASTVKVEDQGGKALVLWSAAFRRGDPGANPPAELNDAAALKAVEGLYQAGFAALSQRFGAA